MEVDIVMTYFNSGWHIKWTFFVHCRLQVLCRWSCEYCSCGNTLVDVNSMKLNTDDRDESALDVFLLVVCFL